MSGGFSEMRKSKKSDSSSVAAEQSLAADGATAWFSGDFILSARMLIAPQLKAIVRFLSCAGMDSELLDEVKAFVAEFWLEPKGRLSAETSVNLDLGMDGDDGVEFMQAFSLRFGVDLSAFPHDKYFGPEAPATPISVVEAIIRRVKMGRWSDLCPLRVGALAEAAENRSWVVESRPGI